MINSIKAYNSYGVAPSNLRFMMNNLFYMPEQYKDCLEGYFIQEWLTEEFLSDIKEGSLPYMGRTYQIIYHKTDPTKLLRRQEHTSVKLSFRVADPVFNILPTVLVMEVQ